MNITNNILQCIGGLKQNYLYHLLESDSNDDDNNMLNSLQLSPYYDSNLVNLLKTKKKHFNVLSSNLDSLQSKIPEIKMFIEELEVSNIKFSGLIVSRVSHIKSH